MRPSKPTSPAELAVIAWAAILVFVVLGGVAMWYSMAASAPADVANQLRTLGWIFFAIAVAIWGATQLCRKLLG